MARISAAALTLALAACTGSGEAAVPEVLATAAGTPFGIVADPSGVYWTSAGAGEDGGRILRLAPGADEPQVLASGLVTPFDLVLDSKRVYWTELGDEAAPGSVKTVA